MGKPKTTDSTMESAEHSAGEEVEQIPPSLVRYFEGECKLLEAVQGLKKRLPGFEKVDCEAVLLRLSELDPHLEATMHLTYSSVIKENGNNAFTAIGFAQKAIEVLVDLPDGWFKSGEGGIELPELSNRFVKRYFADNPRKAVTFPFVATCALILADRRSIPAHETLAAVLAIVPMKHDPAIRDVKLSTADLVRLVGGRPTKKAFAAAQYQLRDLLAEVDRGNEHAKQVGTADADRAQVIQELEAARRELSQARSEIERLVGDLANVQRESALVEERARASSFSDKARMSKFLQGTVSLRLAAIREGVSAQELHREPIIRRLDDVSESIEQEVVWLAGLE